MHSIDFDIAHGAKFNHQVIYPVLNKFIIPEDELLLTFVTLPAKVSSVAGHHGPLALLDHEIHQFHGSEAHIVLSFSTPLVECRCWELKVTVVWVVLDGLSFPSWFEEAGKLVENVVLVLTIHLNVTYLTEFYHDQRCNHVQRVGRFEFHLLLPDISWVSKIARVTNLQSPTALLGHEACQLHGQLAHVVLTLIAPCLVDFAVVGCHAIVAEWAHSPALFAKPVVLL